MKKSLTLLLILLSLSLSFCQNFTPARTDKTAEVDPKIPEENTETSVNTSSHSAAPAARAAPEAPAVISLYGAPGLNAAFEGEYEFPLPSVPAPASVLSPNASAARGTARPLALELYLQDVMPPRAREVVSTPLKAKYVLLPGPNNRFETLSGPFWEVRRLSAAGGDPEIDVAFFPEPVLQQIPNSPRATIRSSANQIVSMPIAEPKLQSPRGPVSSKQRTAAEVSNKPEATSASQTEMARSRAAAAPAVSSANTGPDTELRTRQSQERDETAQPNDGRREIFARPGDDIVVSFDKEGWLFLGFASQIDSDALEFRERSQADGSTIFNFTARGMGSYELPFMYQNNTSGTQERIVLDVHVVSATQFEGVLSNGQNSQPIDRNDYLHAERLTASGRYEDALSAYLKHYKEASPYLNEQIADLYWKTDQFQKALGYRLKNVTAPGQYSSKAVVGTVLVALKVDDYSLVLQFMKPFLDTERPSLHDDAAALARYCIAKADFQTAKDVLDHILANQANDSNTAEIIFLLGQIYEANSELKDYRKARDAYKEVYTQFPESLVSEAAKEKVKFLNRHFFFIR